MVLIGVAHVVSVVIIFTFVRIFGYAVPVMIPAGRIAIRHYSALESVNGLINPQFQIRIHKFLCLDLIPCQTTQNSHHSPHVDLVCMNCVIVIGKRVLRSTHHQHTWHELQKQSLNKR